MAKNYKYLWTWTGQESGYYYKLEMTPSDLTALSSPTTYTQSKASIVGLDYAYEFDKYRYGLCNTNLDITFNTNFLTSTLKQELFNPFTDFIDANKLSQTLHSKTTYVSFTTGNLFKLTYSLDNVTFVPIFTGTQTSGIEADFDIQTKELKISCEDLTKTVLNAITIDNFSDVWDYNAGSDCAEIFDTYVLNYGSGVIRYNSSFLNGRFYGWVTSISDMNDYLNTLVDLVATAIYRASTSVNFNLIDLTYSNIVTQTLWDYGTSTIDTASVSLSSSQVFLMHHVSMDSYTDRATATDISGNNVGGCFYSWKETYKTVYDLYVDLLQNLGLVGYSYHLGTSFYMIHTTIYQDDTYLLTPNLNHLSGLKFYPQYEILKSVSSQLVENAEKNISETKTEKPFSRNDNSYTIPIAIHNLPLSNAGGDVTFYNGGSTTGHVTENFHFTCLLNGSINDIRTDRFDRVSEYMNFDIMNDGSVTATDIKTIDTSIAPVFGSNLDELDKEVNTWQASYGLPKILCDTILGLFGDTSNSTIEFETKLTEFSQSAINALLTPLNAKFLIDATDLDSDLTGFKDRYYPIKLSVNLMNERANATVFGGQ